MDSETSTRPGVDLLESVLLDGNAEPTYVPLSLLEDITNSFSDEHEIGKGGFAVVYKGIVGKGMVAVKKLSTFSLHEDKFHKEVECLIKARHKNIVRFLGYCSDTQGRIADAEGKFVMADIRNWLLCFEYVPNGSLEKYIADASRGLEWRERFGIIKGICEGLVHLHERRILHLDLKPGNILVDDDMIPKITDFGLSRCLDKEQTEAFTSNVSGSLGYFAPELFRGQIAYASDIYSLGVIILEMLTGEKGCPEDDNVVENWMTRLEGSDQRDTQLEQVRICTKIGIECMDFDPKKRPVARHIYDTLDKTASTVETVISSSSELEQKDTKEQAEMEDITEYDGEDHWQQGQEEAPGDQWAEGSSIPNSSSSAFFKSMFTTRARRNYMSNGGPMLKEASVKLYKKRELQHILKDNNITGNGTSGEEYKGLVDNVPVKLKKLLTSGPLLQNVQFANEVIIQYQIIHRGILRLIGVCVELDSPILVYELPSKGSLHDILHGSNKVPLNLDLRLAIAAQSAGALAYFHSACYIILLHGDVKPATILLDDNFQPKISNLGISRFHAKDHEHTGIVLGEISYTDPEYLRTGVLIEKSDVYSFGVVMLELFTRKKARFFDNNSLVKIFLENHKMGRRSTKLFDKEIALTRDLELLEKLAEIAVECLNHDVAERPTMTEVAERLNMLQRYRRISENV